MSSDSRPLIGVVIPGRSGTWIFVKNDVFQEFEFAELLQSRSLCT